MLRIQNDHSIFSNKTLFLFAFFGFIFTTSFSVWSQNQEWLSWTDGNNVTSIAIEGTTIWAGTTTGLVKLNRLNGEKEFFTTSNSLLPSNSIKAVSIDNLGNIWVGSDKGLSKISGQTITTFNPSNSGLPSNYILVLYIDYENNVWIGTEDGGVSKYNGSEWVTYSTENSGLLSNAISSIARETNGTVWFGTPNAGIFSFNGSEWKSYTIGNSDLDSYKILCLAIGPDGTLWTGTHSYYSDGLYPGGGVSYFNGSDWVNINYQVQLNTPEILPVSNNKLFVCNWYGGLATLEREGDTWNLFSLFSTNGVTGLSLDSDKNLWVSTSNKLLKYDGTSLFSFGTSVAELPSFYTTGVHVAQDNSIWFGTTQGLARFDGSNWSDFSLFNSKFQEKWINDIISDENGVVWAGTRSGLVKIDGESWTFSDTLNGLVINTLSIDSQKNLWVGTQNHGLAKFDGINWTFYTTANSGIGSNDILDLAFDSKGTLWIGTYFGGVVSFNGQVWKIYRSANSGITDNLVKSIAVDQNDVIWAGTWNEGLCSFDGNNWTSYKNSPTGLKAPRIEKLFVDKNNKKWIGTYGNGLISYDDQVWTYFNQSEYPLVGYDIVGLDEDKNGNIWIATTEGVNAYNPNGVVLEIQPELHEMKIAELYNNYPNPFNPETKIEFSLKTPGAVTINVFDVLGRKIETKIIKLSAQGRQSVTFSSNGLTSGIYFYQLVVNNQIIETKKMMLIK